MPRLRVTLVVALPKNSEGLSRALYLQVPDKEIHRAGP